MITMGRMRGRLCALTLSAVCLQAGCDKERTLMCAASIDDACAAAGTCVLTWAEAEGATSFCTEVRQWSPLRIDCGSYHVVTVPLTDASRTYYYDASSGMLTAIVMADAIESTTTCVAGPPGGFTPPICGGSSSHELPQCLDAGVADAVGAD
jgi:hypothetical protein